MKWKTLRQDVEKCFCHRLQAKPEEVTLICIREDLENRPAFSSSIQLHTRKDAAYDYYLVKGNFAEVNALSNVVIPSHAPNDLRSTPYG